MFRLHPGEIYIHDAYTLPYQRGKNICPVISTIIYQGMITRYDKNRVVKYVRP